MFLVALLTTALAMALLRALPARPLVEPAQVAFGLLRPVDVQDVVEHGPR